MEILEGKSGVEKARQSFEAIDSGIISISLQDKTLFPYRVVGYDGARVRVFEKGVVELSGLNEMQEVIKRTMLRLELEYSSALRSKAGLVVLDGSLEPPEYAREKNIMDLRAKILNSEVGIIAVSKDSKRNGIREEKIKTPIASIRGEPLYLLENARENSENIARYILGKRFPLLIECLRVEDEMLYNLLNNWFKEKLKTLLPLMVADSFARIRREEIEILKSRHTTELRRREGRVF